MSRNFFLIASLVCAVLMFGCSKSETTNNSNTAASNPEKPAAAENSKPAENSKAAESTASSGDKIGVPECDDFIAKYEACTNKVPEMVRAQYKDALTRWRTDWKKLADDPRTRPQLASACKQAADAQVAAWNMYGCGK